MQRTGKGDKNVWRERERHKYSTEQDPVVDTSWENTNKILNLCPFFWPKTYKDLSIFVCDHCLQNAISKLILN